MRRTLAILGSMLLLLALALWAWPVAEAPPRTAGSAARVEGVGGAGGPDGEVAERVDVADGSGAHEPDAMESGTRSEWRVVEAGAEVALDVVATRRAWVEVQLAAGDIAVQVVDTRSLARVQVFDCASTWGAFLPPGDYEVVWRTRAGPVRRRIAVQREDLVVSPNR